MSTYRVPPCGHCGNSSAHAECQSCGAKLCESCFIEARCPGCLRAVLAQRTVRMARLCRLLGAGGLLAVIALGVTVLGLGISRAAGRAERSLISDTRQQLHEVERALALYTAAHGDCPEALDSLYTRGYLERRRLQDVWEQPVDYQCLANTRSRQVRLTSAGSDQTLGTEDDILVRGSFWLSPDVTAQGRGGRAGRHLPR